MMIWHYKKINFYGILFIATLGGWGMISGAWAEPTSPPTAADKFSIPFTTKHIPLNHKNITLTRVGKLRYMGGINITSSKRRFGGISSFVISPNGEEILGISDRGLWLTATIVYDQNNHLVGLSNGRMAPLRNIKNHPEERARDPEALTAIDGSGYVVSYESPHTLRYFQANKPYDFRSLLTASAEKLTFVPNMPDSYAALPKNLGVEALTTLPDGRLLAISENTHTREGVTLAQGWIIGRGRVEALNYEIDPAFRPTDMATLPDGDILVLERHFSLAKGMAARLTRLSTKSIKIGQSIKGTVIADLAYPFNLDNMEALAVRQNKAGETMVYIMSDNNYNRLQRNLLMMFKIDDGIDTKKAAENINGLNRILVKAN